MQDDTMKALRATSYLSGGNAAYIEELYELYLKTPNAVPEEWRQVFDQLPATPSNGIDVSHAEIRDHFIELAKKPRGATSAIQYVAAAPKQEGVDDLMMAYRRFGHLAAKTDPLGVPRPEVPELQLGRYHLSETDLGTTFQAGSLMGGKSATLQEIIKQLQHTYTRSIGAEYSYIRDAEEVKWIQNFLEQQDPEHTLKNDQRRELLNLLTAAEGLERYLGNRFVGQKRFSLEGSDALIPLMEQTISESGAAGVREIVIGMAHRGRLNVLVNVMGKSPEVLFREFEGRNHNGLTSGDVKYHLGYSSDVAAPKGPVHLSLGFNPSHLEVIASVVLGSVRARQDRYDDKQGDHVLPIQIHGDAAFAGQGIVMETLNMSQTRAYRVGGAIHIVINNQVGFTTSDPRDARSSEYCTDPAKMIDAPVFHVNGDDPEAVIFIAKLAVAYRQRFHKDIVIDLVSYRRHGHNEADEPSATQPLMYHTIKEHSTVRELYAKKLIEVGVLGQDEADQMVDDYRNALDEGKQVIVKLQSNPDRFSNDWSLFQEHDIDVAVDTTVPRDIFTDLAKKILHLPKNFELQRQVGNMMAARQEMAAGKQPIDWGFAENMAYATLLNQGYPIRFTGQDCGRGTFGHRHAKLYDQQTGECYVPLTHLEKDQPSFQIYDSLLSEAGVVGFEYGYAKTQPNTLVIWEAQFGDFSNGAQVVIDQFISSGWQKWQQLSGLVLLLPHGYEGMGPEHSSARLERYMQLCAQHNMLVCVPTTPAQVFHMLRRQVIWPLRLPLIVMSPKSLLRHKLAVSTPEELTNGSFQLVIPEIDSLQPAKVKKVVLCSGKVYYDLLATRRENKQEDVAIVRVEQLYPFPYIEVRAALESYSKATRVVWCQEEPQNQGAWFIIRERLMECLSKDQPLDYAGRKASAAPAAGYPALHKEQQLALVAEALKTN